MKNLSWLIGSLVAANSLLVIACSDSKDDTGGSGATGGTGATGATGGKGGTGGSAGTATTAGTGGTAMAGTGGTAGGMAGASTGGMGGMRMAPACGDIPALAGGNAGFTISTTEWGYCMPIPAVHTCDQKPFPQGSSPAISWTAGPTGTQSYAVVLKDIAVLARTDSTDPLYNRGYHYVIWDIPPTVMSLPAAMMGGHVSMDVPGALQWSNFNNYGYFGPCPNFDPTMPTTYNDSYAFIVYALPTAHASIPAADSASSPVRQLDDAFKTVALAVAEYRGTSSAASSGVPAGTLPPTDLPPCATDGSAPPAAGCIANSNGGMGGIGGATGGVGGATAGAGGTPTGGIGGATSGATAGGVGGVGGATGGRGGRAGGGRGGAGAGGRGN